MQKSAEFVCHKKLSNQNTLYSRRENRSTYMQLQAKIRWAVNIKQMYDHQITYLSSNQRWTHVVQFMLFRSQKIKQHESVGVLIVRHIFVVTVVTSEWRVSWFNDFIRRFSQETKPRPCPQKLANFIDRLTAPLGQRVDTLLSVGLQINRS